MHSKNMAKNHNQISLLDFVILQFFYAFQSLYEGFMSIWKWNFWKERQPLTNQEDHPAIKEKRHFIQLYKPDPSDVSDTPMCFMNVIEFDSSVQEEELRKRKRSYDFSFKQKGLTYYRHRRCQSDQEIDRFSGNFEHFKITV